MTRSSPRLETVRQLLHHLSDARSGGSELLMKEVWENCEGADDFRETEHELGLVIAFLENRKLELGGPMSAEAVVRALGGSVEAFEAACREASPEMLEDALAILTAPDPEASPAWAVERKWGAALLARILDERWDV